MEDTNITGANAKYVFIDVKTGLIYDGTTSGDMLWDKIIANPNSVGWKGPYLNLDHKERKVSYANPWPAAAAGTAPQVSYGTPLDPWGNPYLLFTKLGMMNEFTTGGNPGQIVQSVTMSDGGTYSNLDQRFDRPTVLSLGPNGVPGNGAASAEPEFGMGDDIFRQF